MACAYAKYTGKLGACIATSGPGAIHLLNGLYDAKADNTPVIAITGTTYSDLMTGVVKEVAASFARGQLCNIAVLVLPLTSAVVYNCIVHMYLGGKIPGDSSFEINIQEGIDSTIIIPNDLNVTPGQAMISFNTENGKLVQVRKEDTDLIQVFTNLDTLAFM
jgi:hypothetical protein